MTVDEKLPTTAQVHPLVLLSVVDHYNRTASNTNKRVIGALLGQRNGSTFNVAISYALPFDEDDGVFFLDHHYLETMFEMFKKINPYERVIGWYHTGPKLRQTDMDINDILCKYVPQPLLLVVDVEPASDKQGLPIEAYFAHEQVKDDGTAITKNFEHIASEVVAEEAEEIGVEHLLRDVKDNAAGDLSARITQTIQSLGGLQSHLTNIQSYMAEVIGGQLPVNHAILQNLQKMMNLLPNLQNEEVIRSFNVVNNDRLAVVYLSSLSRSIVALHDLIDNKLLNAAHEKKQQEVPVAPAAVEKAEEDQMEVE